MRRETSGGVGLSQQGKRKLGDWARSTVGVVARKASAKSPLAKRKGIPSHLWAPLPLLNISFQVDSPVMVPCNELSLLMFGRGRGESMCWRVADARSHMMRRFKIWAPALEEDSRRVERWESEHHIPCLMKMIVLFSVFHP
jgi:hypothetical protein